MFFAICLLSHMTHVFVSLFIYFSCPAPHFTPPSAGGGRVLTHPCWTRGSLCHSTVANLRLCSCRTELRPVHRGGALRSLSRGSFFARMLSFHSVSCGLITVARCQCSCVITAYTCDLLPYGRTDISIVVVRLRWHPLHMIKSCFHSSPLQLLQLCFLLGIHTAGLVTVNDRYFIIIFRYFPLFALSFSKWPTFSETI